MKKIILTSAMALAISVPVLACGGPGKIFSELDLTDDQVAQLKEYRQEKREIRKANKAERAQMKERKQALLANYSDSEAEAFASDVAEKAKQRTLARLKGMQKVMEILTPEQQLEFKKLMAEHSEEHGHRGKGRHDMFF